MDSKDSKMSYRGIGLGKKMKFGIFQRLTAGYLVVLFLLGASNVYAILKLVQFNTLILNSYNEDIRLLDSEKKIVDSLFSQRRFEQKYILTKDTILYNQFLSAKEDFERTLRRAQYHSGFSHPKRFLQNNHRIPSTL